MDEILKQLKSKIETLAQGRYGVYFHVPEKAPYPYVSLELQERQEGYGKIQGEILCAFWSRYPGVQEVMREADLLEKNLEGYGEEGRFIFRLKSKKSKLLADGLTRQGLLTFRFMGRT